jgi:hypothetical protein
MDTGEVDARTRAAVDLADGYVFGTEPGRIPAVLFEAHDTNTADLDRALLGSALARYWSYGGSGPASPIRTPPSTGDCDHLQRRERRSAICALHVR